MGEIDVSKLIWVNYDNWHLLEGTDYYGNKRFVLEKDIDSFIESVCEELSVELDIPYEDLLELVFSYNKSFFTSKRALYDVYYSLSKHGTDYINLIGKFKVPAISNLVKCLELFNSLSEKEKSLFFARINNN